MNESMVTFQGWLGGDVRTQQAGGAPVRPVPRRQHAAAAQPVDAGVVTTARPSGTR